MSSSDVAEARGAAGGDAAGAAGAPQAEGRTEGAAGAPQVEEVAGAAGPRPPKGSLEPTGDGDALHMLVLDMQVLEGSSRPEPGPSQGPRLRGHRRVQSQQRQSVAGGSSDSEMEGDGARVWEGGRHGGGTGQEVALYGVTSEGSSICCRVAGERQLHEDSVHPVLRILLFSLLTFKMKTENLTLRGTSEAAARVTDISCVIDILMCN